MSSTAYDIIMELKSHIIDMAIQELDNEGGITYIIGTLCGVDNIIEISIYHRNTGTSTIKVILTTKEIIIRPSFNSTTYVKFNFYDQVEESITHLQSQIRQVKKLAAGDDDGSS